MRRVAACALLLASVFLGGCASSGRLASHNAPSLLTSRGLGLNVAIPDLRSAAVAVEASPLEARESVEPYAAEMPEDQGPLGRLRLGSVAPSLSVTNPIDAARRVDWSTAGPIGGIDTTRTQCGSTVSAGASTATINTAITNCTAGHYVLLGPGAFTQTDSYFLKNNVTLRGSGANSTFITRSGATFNCDFRASMCLRGSIETFGQLGTTHGSWTAGYTKGGTSITLSTSVGIAVGTVINLTQKDETTDTGTIFNCLDDVNFGCTQQDGNSGGYAMHNEGSCPGATVWCSQIEQVLVTACSPSCNNAGSTVLTIAAPGLVWPNWSSGKSPGAWWASTQAVGMAVENLSIDNLTGGTSAIMFNCNGCWVRGIRSLVGGRNHVWLFQCFHCAVLDSYFYEAESHATTSYGIELSPASSWGLIENNIGHKGTDSLPNHNGGGVGSVAGYNFSLNNQYASNGLMQMGDYEHASGYGFWLREGGDQIGLIADNVHGGHNFTTAFRNRYAGTQTSCNGVGCSIDTMPINLFINSRYFNVIGNVLGTSGYHTKYKCLGSASDCVNGNTSIYALGCSRLDCAVYSGAHFCGTEGCGSQVNGYDPLTPATAMLYGNWDVVSASNVASTNDTVGIKWDATEVPSGTTFFPNAVPASHTLPASLYLSARPSWFRAGVPFPVNGPDVTNGNLANTGGHANMNSAEDCFVNVMGGSFSSSALAFDADLCYGAR